MKYENQATIRLSISAMYNKILVVIAIKDTFACYMLLPFSNDFLFFFFILVTSVYCEDAENGVLVQSELCQKL